MNPSTSRALDRVLRQMSRPPRVRRSRFSTAPILLGLALGLGYLLLARLVPMYWASMLPHGLPQATTFRGWPGLVWSLAVHCHRDFAGTATILGGTALVGLVLSTFARPLRPVVWLMAAAAVAADAGIVYVTIRTAAELTLRNAGMM